MLSLISIQRNNEVKEKRHITVTGRLANVVKPGFPALYIFNGNLIRTSAVQSILEANAEGVRFETRNSIYTILYPKDRDVNSIA